MRNSSLRNPPIVPFEGNPHAVEMDQKSDKVVRTGNKRRLGGGTSERGRTIGSGIKSSKHSVVNFFREKNIELRMKK